MDARPVTGNLAPHPAVLFGAPASRRTSTPWAFDWTPPDEDLVNRMHARFYGASLGRFMRPDPVSGTPSDPQSWNLYSYVRNNPVNFTDPTGLMFVQLGQHTDDEIKKKLGEIKQEMKNKDITKEQKSALKEERKGLEVERQGNRVVGDMLAKLDQTGERNGMTLQDFTLSTDTRADFASAPAATVQEMMRKDAFVLPNHPTMGGTIFIRTEHSGGFYQMSQGNRDWGYYGASALSHEQVHQRRNPSEYDAYGRQSTVFQGFRSFFGSSDLYRYFDAFLQQQITANAP